MPNKTPILFLVFNRPDTTLQVFEAIARYKPSKLYVAADGPRSAKQGEAELCEQTRQIISKVNWPCEVKTLFRETNLGCKVAVSSAINWFFEHEEEGIILEDDCLPNESFFTFCNIMLERYRDDERIMHIAGANFQFGKMRSDGDYYFSRYNHIWGWASWRRAWKYYDVEMRKWPKFKEDNLLNRMFTNKYEAKYWHKIFDLVHKNKVNTWDYQWTFSIWCQGGLTVIPQNNLISNIGFGANGTHTSSLHNPLANMQTVSLNSYNEPSFLLCNSDADTYSLLNSFSPNILKLVKRKITSILAGK